MYAHPYSALHSMISVVSAAMFQRQGWVEGRVRGLCAAIFPKASVNLFLPGGRWGSGEVLELGWRVVRTCQMWCGCLCNLFWAFMLWHWQYVVRCDVHGLRISLRGRLIEDLDGESRLEQMPSKYGCALGGTGRSEWWELDKEGIDCAKVVWEEQGSGCKDARCLTITRQDMH